MRMAANTKHACKYMDRKEVKLKNTITMASNDLKAFQRESF